MVEGQNTRKSKIVFVAGWVMSLLSLLAIAFAVWMPIYIRIRPNQPFFFLDKQVPYLFLCCVVLIAYAAVALGMVLVASRLMYSTVNDNVDSAAAEASMKIARVMAVVSSIICFVSFVVVMRMYKLWYSYLQSQLN